MKSTDMKEEIKKELNRYLSSEEFDKAVGGGNYLIAEHFYNYAMNMKFTDQEKELLQEMLDFPSSYKLTPKGVEVVKGLLKKIQEID